MPEKPSIIQSDDVILKAEDRDDADPTYTPQNILLTGGCGFIGSHVCKYLVSSKAEKIGWIEVAEQVTKALLHSR